MDRMMLLEIHNQCAKMQHSIALHYDTPDNEALINDLIKLYELLKSLLRV